MRLEICQTWDGRPVAESASVCVAVVGKRLHVVVDSPYYGDPPPSSPTGRLDGLWDHEVVELFIRGAGGDYTEIELGPHGHWLALRLRAIRVVCDRDLHLDHAAQIVGKRWRGAASLALEDLPTGPWTGNAYAIHGVGLTRRYLVHRPTGGARPDFHRPDGDVSIVPSGIGQVA